ncbi:HNH endonuclease [Hoyosella sp. YIM 151337]|uniref:HNH endonuclease signature motif containing protein n=1 Tax=Hoyosella sp. YIM 151337 TaxID=2992742 RepID=UPI0022354862|nr:HNH endonuclease signature motif containing protein [Hoyosella sp. YIM 151337]MCW4354381.1 HNH endonuclease [Hoyosella sp. YIM 151337]
MLGGNITDSAGLYRLADADLVGCLQESERQLQRAAGLQAAVIAEISARGTMATFGYANAAGLLKDVLNLDAADARRRARRSEVLAGQPTTAGGERIPVLPLAAAAFAAAEISAAHVDAIDDVLSQFPAATPPDARSEGEDILATLAKTNPPAVIRKVGREILARLDQDGVEPPETDLAKPKRELRLRWSSRGDHLKLSGFLDKEAGARLESLLSPLAKPRPDNETGAPDVRTVDERCGDAVAELLERTERAADLPAQGGEPPHVIVTMTLDQLTNTSDIPLVLLNRDHLISAALARQIACDAKIIPAILGSNSEVLDLGRAERTVSVALRRALVMRDKGCIFPGCDKPAPWTQAHHIREWQDGGPTDLSNLCLLCSYHHRLIHHSDWTVRMGSDGHPDVIPPVWLDAQQTPRRNTFHQRCRTPGPRRSAARSYHRHQVCQPASRQRSSRAGTMTTGSTSSLPDP